jgi:hypothetical protein
MQRIFACLLVSLLVGAGPVFGQQVNMPADSLPGVLCHAWASAYAMMGNTKIEMKPGAAGVILNFVSDHTLIAVSPKDKKTGRWTYDPALKQIRWEITGGGNGTIISLTADEMVVLMDTKKATPDDPSDLKIVYKRRQL